MDIFELLIGFVFKFKIARKQLWKSSNVSPNLFPVYMLSTDSSFFLYTFNKSEFYYLRGYSQWT